MLELLKQEVLKANQLLKKYNLVTFTWGNISGINRKRNLIVIKPSGVPYAELTADKMVVVNLKGEKVEGDLNPSSDTATHLELYKKFAQIGGVGHTHSPWATTWAQSGNGIPALGTTHADYFYGEIPCTKIMEDKEIANDYEEFTGQLIIDKMQGIDPLNMPAILVNNHGPFTWGENSIKAVENAVVLEEVARLAFYTKQIDNTTPPISSKLLDKHFLRKHGENAYYGQKTD